MRYQTIIGMLALFLPVVVGQVPAVPKFDVASIKLCKGDNEGPGRSGGGAPARSPGRLHINCAPMLGFIANAYLSPQDNAQRPGRTLPIEGAPAWLSSDRYMIDAEADGAPGEQMMRGPMMQALFEDRFQLKVHRETRDIPVYAMTVAKGGPKLRAFQEGSCVEHAAGQPMPGPGEKPWCGLGGMRTVRNGPNLRLSVVGASFLNFSVFLSIILDRPAVDQTGIKGMFDFQLEFEPDETTTGPLPPVTNERRTGADGGPPAAPADPVGGISIFTALRDQLGLKLESAKGPGDFLVIDHIERPSDN